MLNSWFSFSFFHALDSCLDFVLDPFNIFLSLAQDIGCYVFLSVYVGANKVSSDKNMTNQAAKKRKSSMNNYTRLRYP